MLDPNLNGLEMASVEKLFIQSGYVLDFSDRSFAQFFAGYGIDIDGLFPSGSKGNRLVGFLQSGSPAKVATILDALVQLVVERGETPAGKVHIRHCRAAVERLRNQGSTIPTASRTETRLSLAYVSELDEKLCTRMNAADYEGVITVAKTKLEALLQEMGRELIPGGLHPGGDLQKMYKAIAKQLRIDEERKDLDENFKMIVRGLVQVVNGLSPIRNKMGDGHPRVRKAAAHHARLMANATTTVATFLVEAYEVARRRQANAAAATGKAPSRLDSIGGVPLSRVSSTHREI